MCILAKVWIERINRYSTVLGAAGHSTITRYFIDKILKNNRDVDVINLNTFLHALNAFMNASKYFGFKFIRYAPKRIMHMYSNSHGHYPLELELRIGFESRSTCAILSPGN